MNIKCKCDEEMEFMFDDKTHALYRCHNKECGRLAIIDKTDGRVLGWFLPEGKEVPSW